MKSESVDSVEEALLLYCQTVIEKKPIFSKVLSSRYNLQLLLLMHEQLKQYLANIMKNRGTVDERTVKDTLFLIDYHAGAISSMLGTWLQKKEVNLEEELSRIGRVIRGELHG